MQRISPCIWFTGGADEAVKLYISAFKNSKTKKTTHYGKAGAEVSGMKVGDVLVVDFEIAGQSIQALNGGPYYQQTPAMSLFVTCGSPDEVDSIHKKLSPGGKTLIELGKYPFSDRYTFFSDKYGVHWQLIYHPGAEQKVIPAILFGGDKQGLGPQALNMYLTMFKNAKVIVDERYKKGENGKEGSIKHARLSLDGSELVIMDAGHSKPLELNGAISLTINCRDQKEVDEFWGMIGKTGKEIQCGWIEDQFGVSWQVVPEGITDLIYGPDQSKAENAAKAMFQMKKLDIGKLRQAYSGQ